jgi:hypothetical protein
MSAHADILPLKEERLFEPFLDPVDGALCVEASVPLREVASLASAQSLRFPLKLDADASLVQHLDAALYAPASHRFGPFCDNIMGMNWRLPDGRVLRIGEQVAKTTTGYDWLRFLLHTGARYGAATHYVMRLRPDCGFSAVAFLEGDIQKLRECAAAILRGAWMHWWESVDFLPEQNGAMLRVGVHCPEREGGMFEAELRRLAAEHGLSLRWQPGEEVAPVGLPDFVMKTTPDRVTQLAMDVQKRGASQVVAFYYHGVLHGRLAGGLDVASIVEPFEAGLHEIGGDWHARHGVGLPHREPESRWMEVLRPVLLSA